MHATTKTSTKPTLAKTLAPEDIAGGDYVALLSIDRDFPLLAWLCDPMPSQQSEVIRLKQRIDLCRDPFRVLEVCLPFVFIKRPSGQHATLDVRCCELVRLDPAYAKRVWKALKPKKRSAKRNKGSKRKK